MKTLIVCTSVSHGNTRRVADVIGQTLQARVVTPEQVDGREVCSYDLVGFGSGVFSMALHPDLRKFVEALPNGPRGSAFVFATSGFGEPPFRRYLRSFERLLDRKGFEVLGSFSCRARDTYGPFKLIGGIRKARPNAADLQAARAFAAGLRTELTSPPTR